MSVRYVTEVEITNIFVGNIKDLCDRVADFAVKTYAEWEVRLWEMTRSFCQILDRICNVKKGGRIKDGCP